MGVRGCPRRACCAIHGDNPMSAEISSDAAVCRYLAEGSRTCAIKERSWVAFRRPVRRRTCGDAYSLLDRACLLLRVNKVQTRTLFLFLHASRVWGRKDAACCHPSLVACSILYCFVSIVHVPSVGVEGLVVTQKIVRTLHRRFRTEMAVR